MSNTQVGNIYQQIIGDVVETSRVDFEEGGVDEQVLEELRRGWQQKLSQLKVATFPWDPKPEPQQQIANPPTVPSNAGNYQPMSAPPPQQAMYTPQMNNGPRIKSEPGLDSPTSGQPQAPYQPAPILPPQATTAQQRAAMNLQANYGQRAAASINAIQGNMSQQQQAQPTMPHQMQQQASAQQQAAYQQHMAQQMQQQRAAAGSAGGVPAQQRAPPQMTTEAYRQAQAAYAQQAQQRLQAQNGVNGAQTDGAGDEMEESVSVIKRMNADGEEVMGRIEIDGLIRDKIASMGQSMEGGGLMLPLREATNSKKRQRKVKKSSSAPGQYDGGSDDEDSKDQVKDEDLDEDAINSDLDDPDDALNGDEDDDEGMGHIMLCMYDKVQRVKNKWKCVMKDGVLTVNGKEYVFHKASGEYEW